ncbi:MAG: ABC transporter substrate-binding protein [Gammaproteobacteria bacterium]|nr:ABC transporter substrate-binding protein [Gammaproteobacteria bacterium]
MNLKQLLKTPIKALGLSLCLGASIPLMAATLTIGRANEPQSIDPLFSRTGNNQMTAIHVYDRLVSTDKNVRNQPGLAERWENVNPTTWRIYLRKGVKWHDGRDLTADDVLFSMERAPNVPNSPASFAGSVASIQSMKVIDAHTIEMTSKSPDPLFINNIGTVYIMPKHIAETAVNADYNSGKAAIGTGPYQFVEWVPGDRLVLKRNPNYWGTKPAYDEVVMKFISNDAARVAALLSGSVDLIDLVPPSDVQMLRNDPKFTVHQVPSVRLIYLALTQRDKTPLFTDSTGQPLTKNPFQDTRVRQAVNLMINRDAIVDRVLSGAGEPAGQTVPEGVFGFDGTMSPVKPDLAKAKALLTEAGYPNGFGLTLFGSNDRFSQDGEVTQALGQLLARGGLQVNEVKTMPYSVYAKEAGKGAFPAFVFSYGNSTGEASRGLLSMFHTYDKDGTGHGTLNRFRYSNPTLDALLVEATQDFNDDSREAKLQKAMALAMQEAAIVPLYFQSVAWASRAEIAFEARKDERTLAMGAAPK